jgi:type I restriction-modification system DNA methylase subunit
MNRDPARSLIRQTFTQSFDRTRFRNFVINLLNIIDESKAQSWNKTYVKDAFKPGINRYERLGTYTDAAGEKIDILITYLEKESSIERARTFLRNFVADYLATRGQKEAALVAFVSPSEADWRFSLVKMEYTAAEDESGKVKVTETLTPARRYSFLVGENEDSHTAQAQLVDILADSDRNPTLADLEHAFSVERVTKEFWEKYKKLYLDVKDALDEVLKSDASVRHDFESKGINPVDFAKKLLGQIVFLYFLQKKGWFGVARDAQWGTGPKDFLRKLFDQRRELGAKRDHFFNHILEPLFYEALARERDEDFYSRFDCKIPFLNGGLFDPLNNYDWVHTDIVLADALFSNDDTTAQGDKGTGILDVFDRYNFTVNEAEPLDKEVAVDPEMLGKVFENLLGVKERKSKGSYYTPREIVYYMCRQSLTSYLETELSSAGVSRDEIESFLRVGEQAADFEMARLAGTESYSPKLPVPVETNAHLIDQKLEEITVCDPAVGSGAFLVGMMSEIVRGRKTLTPYFANKTSRSAYEFKRHAIQSSLYGVDIDPGAVEIAKLRLWLSLVVDEDDIKQIKPLPNLDYKIMQGDSLVEEFEGIKLLDERLIERPPDNSGEKAALKARIAELSHDFFDLHNRGNRDRQTRRGIEKEIAALKKQIKALDAPVAAATPVQREFGDLLSEVQRKLPELRRLHRELFEAASGAKKKELREELFALEWEFMDATVRENGDAAALKHLQRLRTLNYRPFFLWKLYFLEAFQNKGGFDVLIANPPYGFRQIHSESAKQYFKAHFIAAHRSFEHYFLFYEASLKLLKAEGVLAFIAPVTWLTIPSAESLREFILKGYAISEICWLSEEVFENASVNTLISLIQRREPTSTVVKFFKERSAFPHAPEAERTIPQTFFVDAGYYISIFSGADEAAVLDKVRLISRPLADFARPCSGYNPYEVGTGVAPEGGPHTEQTVSEKPYHSIRKRSREWKAEIVGRDLTRYHVRITGERWIKYGPWLAAQRDPENFKGKRILVQEITGGRDKRLVAAFYEGELYHSRDVIPIKLNEKPNPFYLLGLINSWLLSWYHQKCNPKAQKRLFPKVLVSDLKKLPICPASEAEQRPIAQLVEQIVVAKQREPDGDTTVLEREIDRLVYELYGLTVDEINLVEGSAL